MESSFDLGYSGDIALLSGDSWAVQHLLEHLAIKVSRPGKCFEPSKWKYFNTDTSLYLNFCDDRLKVVNSSKYLGNIIKTGGIVGKEIALSMAKRLKQIPWTCDTCRAALTSGFPSKEGCTKPQFEVLFKAVTPGPGALSIPGAFLYSSTGVTETLLESD